MKDVDFFSFAYKLTLENTASGRGAESRLGAFILYNTARLSTLLQRFDQAVTEGKLQCFDVSINGLAAIEGKLQCFDVTVSGLLSSASRFGTVPISSTLPDKSFIVVL